MSKADVDTRLDLALERLRSNAEDQAAWADIVRITWPFVLAIAHRHLPALRRVLDAEDVAQDVFVKFARYWRTQRPEVDHESILTLLALMTRQIAHDARRWERRARRDIARQSLSDYEAQDAGHGHEESELRDLLGKVCVALNREERQVLGMRLQGFSNREIAATMNVATRTVDRKLERVKEVLALQLDLPDERHHSEG